MKRLFVGALCALLSAFAFGVTYTPVQLLNPAGSSAGQAIVSTGSSSSPAWGGIGVNGIAAIAANTILANATGSSASPTAFAMPSCSTSNSALKYTSGTGITCGTTFALTTGTLAQFAATTSAQLASVISDETGSGALVFATNPTLAGATFSSTLNISSSNPFAVFNATSGTTTGTINFAIANSAYWQIQPTTSSFVLARYNAGTLVDSPFTISASTGVATFADGITANGTVSGTGFSNYLASPPAIGGTAANAGTFTNLTATGTVTGITGRLLGVQVFSASGTYTPTAGTGRAIIRVQAPGGGGGGSTTTGSGQVSIAQGGSAGSYAEAYWTSPSSQTVTIGTVGAAGAAAGTGGTGGTTSVGSIVSCPGGIGGATMAATTAPAANGSAAAPSACTITGATTIVSRQGSQGMTGAAISATQFWNAPGGPSMLGAWAQGYGYGGIGGAIGQSASGAAGFAGGPGIITIFDYQ
ncbi:hypothetical protein [Burkholderia territorii]|uniref:hypothetical protein n=1 Tax=Burkholderia territorii TaxID=1503055 RepID=UPI000AC6E140|nr:hypothetical protein [Burkholderia territorii]